MPIDSREAAQECSPGRKPWAKIGSDKAPAGRKTNAHARAAGLVAVIFTLVPVFSQPSPPQEAPTFRASTSLVLVDVLALNPKTGLPLTTLKREDFRISDNGHEVPLATFDSGATLSTRPLALWFVVICNEGNKGLRGERASGWFSGKETLFRPALDDLAKDDTAGVAHWCDEGTAQLDLRPTPDRDAVIAKLAQVLQPMAYQAPPDTQMRVGELTLQRLVRLIIDDAHHANPQPLPVLFFLHTDDTGMPTNEIDSLVDDLLETSGIVFGVKDAAAMNPPLGRLFGEQRAILHYMARETGGQYFSVPPSVFAAILQAILQQLHFRYQLGFKPPALDGKRHKLKVEFASAARKQYKSVRLHYRPEYIPGASTH